MTLRLFPPPRHPVAFSKVKYRSSEYAGHILAYVGGLGPSGGPPTLRKMVGSFLEHGLEFWVSRLGDAAPVPLIPSFPTCKVKWTGLLLCAKGCTRSDPLRF